MAFHGRAWLLCLGWVGALVALGGTADGGGLCAGTLRGGPAASSSSESVSMLSHLE